MAATTKPLLALTAFDLMSRDVVTIPQDASLRATAEKFAQRQIEVAALVDADGRCVGVLSVIDLLRWALASPVALAPGGGAAEEGPPPACPYQVKGRLLTGGNAVICTRAQGSCPLQEVRPMMGGSHTAVCQLREGVVSDWQDVSGGGHASAVRRYMTTGVPTVGPEVTLSVLARTVIDAHAPRLIVVDAQHRPIGTVSCRDVLRVHPLLSEIRGQR